MKLGILVVYLVEEKNKKLLDLHLRQIEEHTRVPYRIYASTNRLSPDFRPRLEQHPHVQICKCPTTTLRGSEENSFYLEHLVKMAIKDNATHLVTLHVDSFPVRSGWAQELAKKLSEKCVLAAIMRKEDNDQKPHPACLFFHRDFYLAYHPTFRLSKKELSSAEYRHYLQIYEHIADSGVGYGFKVYSQGLTWYPLLKSNRNECHYLFANIYGDAVFHLGFANQKYKLSHQDTLHINSGKTKNPLNLLLFIGSALLPSMFKERVMSLVPRRLMGAYRYASDANQIPYEAARKQLLEKPDSYLKYLRTGSLHTPLTKNKDVII